uniref:RNA polymerase I-specific transcription initiation factor RRN3-like n=1 Tax=Sinocyclocheilus anshuiensis TaxID=1608454 RepID=A0A671MFH0_9TELE
MEIEGRDFLNTPPKKTVRFGGTVANTLAKLQKGDTSDYELIKHQLSDPDIKDAQIISWLQEFRTCVTQLGRDHEQLIYVVLKLPWLGRSQAVVEEYLAFLSNLVSAQTVYLRACLRMVVTNFAPKRIRIQEGNVDISDSDDEDENLPRTFDHCHQALQLITRYVPSTSRFMMPILSDKFPFVQKSSRTLECYVHNLFRVSVYIPDLRRDIIELIISKMLTLDVSAPRSEIEEVESGAQQDANGASQDDCLFDMVSPKHFRKPNACIPDGAVMVHPVAERLDTMMTVLLAYIKDICHVNGSLDIEKTKALYRDLVSVFDKVVLPTHASCHVQYYMFYLCSFRLGLAEAFLDHLWKMLHAPNQPPVLRQAAAGYMGSFMARAKFLPVSTVKACLDLLVPWLHLYINSQDSGSKAFCDVNLHGSFYTACQAVFYTLIFRHNAILEGNMKKGLAYLQGLNLERIVMCQLNPLRVCLPAVTNMFAAITSSGKLIEPIYQVWEEPSDCMIDVPKKKVRKGSMDEEDDFLHGGTPHGDSVVGMTPGSYDSHLHSPRSVGSPPVSFLQRPF